MFNKIKMNTMIVPGCNYHTKWQSKKGMRFVLDNVSPCGTRALLYTRNTGREFWTNVSDLIFIETWHNQKKAAKLKKNLTK